MRKQGRRIAGSKRKLFVAGGVALALFMAWIGTLSLTGAVIHSRVPVALSIFSDVLQIGPDQVKATGTWVIERSEQADPLQTTEIRCERTLRRCTSAAARVINGWQTLMQVEIDIYEISEWGASRIVFVDENPTCVRYVYTIDLLTKSVTGRRVKRENRSAADDPVCKALDSELRLTLKNGMRKLPRQVGSFKLEFRQA